MQRVMIVGGPGSGKSTLARWLGERTGLPVFHMDHIHHLPNWQPRPLAEKQALAQKIVMQHAWVFEGGMSSTYENRAARADTLIWLDLPMPQRLWRVMRRLWLHYGTTRPDMADGCVETFGMHTIEFIIWIVSTRKSQKQKIAQLVATHSTGLKVVHLTRQKLIDEWQARIDPPNLPAYPIDIG